MLLFCVAHAPCCPCIVPALTLLAHGVALSMSLSCVVLATHVLGSPWCYRPRLCCCLCCGPNIPATPPSPIVGHPHCRHSSLGHCPFLATCLLICPADSCGLCLHAVSCVVVVAGGCCSLVEVLSIGKLLVLLKLRGTKEHTSGAGPCHCCSVCSAHFWGLIAVVL